MRQDTRCRGYRRKGGREILLVSSPSGERFAGERTIIASNVDEGKLRNL